MADLCALSHRTSNRRPEPCQGGPSAGGRRRTGPSARRRTGHGRPPAWLAALGFAAWASGVGHGQPPSILPRPFGSSQTTSAPRETSATIARVEGRAITQADFDRVATPYFAQLRATMGAKFNAEVQRTADWNVLDELIRREVLVLEARRQGIEVSGAETDSILARDPFFLTHGVFDAAKFNLFKLGPTSNYEQLLPRLREAAAMNKLDQALRRRFTPTRAAVRAEWARRNDQVRCRYFSLLQSETSLEPEATEAERKAYYDAHPDEFQSKPRMRFRYFKLALPPEGDSLRTSAESTATERARRMADSLRAAMPPDTSAMLDTGLFEVPPATLPGLSAICASGIVNSPSDVSTGAPSQASLT